MLPPTVKMPVTPESVLATNTYGNDFAVVLKNCLFSLSFD